MKIHKFPFKTGILHFKGIKYFILFAFKPDFNIQQAEKMSPIACLKVK